MQLSVVINAMAEAWSSKCSSLGQACTHNLKHHVTLVAAKGKLWMTQSGRLSRKRKFSRFKSIKGRPTTTSTSLTVKQTNYLARRQEMLSLYAKNSLTKSSREKELTSCSRRQSH